MWWWLCFACCVGCKKQRDGHTGARTQDHSVISTALYRLSYTTSLTCTLPTKFCRNHTLLHKTLTPKTTPTRAATTHNTHSHPTRHTQPANTHTSTPVLKDPKTLQRTRNVSTRNTNHVGPQLTRYCTDAAPPSTKWSRTACSTRTLRPRSMGQPLDRLCDFDVAPN